MKNNIKLIALCVIFFASIIGFTSCTKESSIIIPVDNEIQIGALLPLSTSDEGVLGKAAMELSISDLNDLMAAAGSPVRFKLMFQDTESDSLKAIKALEALHAQGVSILAGGPASSMELGAIRDQINNKEMLMLNAYSTAPSLAIPGDNLFRLVPDDTKQSKAISKLLHYDGKNAVIVVWRNDNYGYGLYNAFKSDFESSGGTIINSINYPVNTNDFNLIAADLNDQVVQAKAQFGANKVGICYFGTDESTPMLNAAIAQSDLGSVNWYGCDGNAVLNDMVGNQPVANFAMQVNFTAPNVGIGTARFTPKKTAELSQRIEQATGLQPNVNTLSAYDAVRILGYCYLTTGSLQVASMKSVLPEICASYNLLGISRELNEAGDLLNANYIFWRIEKSGDVNQWETYATYFADGDYIEIK